MHFYALTKKTILENPRHIISPKKIFSYNVYFTQAGLVQPPDKIVVRFTHTIYPYSLYECQISIQYLGFSIPSSSYFSLSITCCWNYFLPHPSHSM